MMYSPFEFDILKLNPPKAFPLSVSCLCIFRFPVCFVFFIVTVTSCPDFIVAFDVTVAVYP